MKKFTSLVLTAVLTVACMVTVGIAWPLQGIADNENNIDATAVKGYIQINGVQMDSHGNVAPQPKGDFTGIVAEGELAEKHPASFNVAIGGDVTEADVRSHMANITGDEDVLKNVIKDYYNKGYIKSNEGEVIPWVEMTTDNYRVEWYVLKYEPHDGFWHTDGRIFDLNTGRTIEIVEPEDPEDIPPEAYDDIEEIIDDPDIPSTPEPELPPHSDPYELKNDHAYIFGRTDTLMEPDDSMKRGEAAAVIYRLLKQNDMLSGFSYDISKTPVYSDTNGRWDRSALEYMNYIGVYPNSDTIGPVDNVKRGEAFKLMAVALGFTDDTSLTDEQYALILHDNNYVVGDESGNFQLDSVITRAEFCKIYNMIIGRDSKLLVTTDGAEVTPETYGFTDISESEWYYDVVLKATSAYDGDYVDLEARGVRNELDDFS